MAVTLDSRLLTLGLQLTVFCLQSNDLQIYWHFRNFDFAANNWRIRRRQDRRCIDLALRTYRHAGPPCPFEYGAIGGSVCMWYIGRYITVADPTKHVTKTPSSGGINAMAFFYLWTIFYTQSWNGTPWVYKSEMHSQAVRPLAQAFAAANNWFCNFIIARFTPQMFDTMDYGVCFFFASLMICSVIFVYFLLPETKDVPLEMMDHFFSRSLPARKGHKIVLAELRMDDEQFRRERTSAAKVDESGYVIDENHVEKV
jgi:hypothetical protein